MSAARAQLHLLPPVEDDLVQVPRYALEELVDGMTSLFDDLEAGVESVRAAGWANNPAAVINNCGRVLIRIERGRADIEPFGGRPTRPRPMRFA